VLEVLYHHAKFGGAPISPAAGVAKNVEFLSVCLTVCLFVTLLNIRVREPDFAMKALEYRNDFDAVGYDELCALLLLLINENEMKDLHLCTRAQLSETDANS